MIPKKQQICFSVALLTAIATTLIFIYAIKPQLKSNYISSSSHPPPRFRRSNYTDSTAKIKKMMVQKMPHGLSTEDNRDRFFRENMCCGG